MKTLTRVIAVLMMVAMLASLMVACGEKKEENHIDNNLVGTWVQTDDKDGTCKLVGGDGFESDGTYVIPEEDLGKIKIKLDKWDKEVMFTYTATEKVIDLESFDQSYYCVKQ